MESDLTRPFWYADGMRTGRNGDGVKMPLDGNKEEEEEDIDVIILCSTDVERVVPGGEAERKFTQNLSRGTTRSTRFRHTKRGTERLATCVVSIVVVVAGDEMMVVVEPGLVTVVHVHSLLRGTAKWG
ncbi:hypothetical protein DVH24_006080 [Malus domestica]|uniref:Uncharacterized protein n=1 Tax=Malus domestica TaxID=3750 RepID=A0A498J5G1_MALDO|nr:hypothetical protein DVH24_006080 [Malus domestica]